jgi:hypothetical protein
MFQKAVLCLHGLRTKFNLGNYVCILIQLTKVYFSKMIHKKINAFSTFDFILQI